MATRPSEQAGKEDDVQVLRRIIVGVILIAASAAFVSLPQVRAQEGQRVPVDSATTAQKAVLVENLVMRSSAAKTIEGSSDADAKAKLDRARDLVTQARADLDAGKVEDANRQLDEALRLVNTEARRIADADIKQERQRDAYAKRLNSVNAFLAAYERVAQEKELSDAARAKLGEIRQAIAFAEQQASSGHMTEAIDALDTAYRNARGDIRAMRDGDTLTRSLVFETPEAEFHYELDRNDSHFMLLKFAIAEKNPPERRLERIEALRSEATDLRAEAEAQASAGEPAAAIDTVIRSTDALLKAIRISGIWIPS